VFIGTDSFVLQADDIQNEAKELSRVRNYIFGQVSKNCGQPLDKVSGNQTLCDISICPCVMHQSPLFDFVQTFRRQYNLFLYIIEIRCIGTAFGVY
jgi:hypothetical protein